MAHECEQCGMECYCDCDDMGGMRQPDNCPHLTNPDACDCHPDNEDDPYPLDDEKATHA